MNCRSLKGGAPRHQEGEEEEEEEEEEEKRREHHLPLCLLLNLRYSNRRGGKERGGERMEVSSLL